MKFNLRTISLIACIGLVAGTFLPWMSNGGISVNGFRGALGNPGGLFLVGAVLLAACLLLSGKWVRRAAILISAFLTFAVLDQLWTAIKLEGVSPGIGLFLLLPGCLLLLVQSVLRREAP